MAKKTLASILLLVFAVIYNLITVSLLENIFGPQSGQMGLQTVMAFFWLVGAVVLFLLVWIMRPDLSRKLNQASLFFSTPMPALIFLLVRSILEQILN